MLNTYFEAVVPAVRQEGARLDQFIGDAVMVTFNVSAEQPDHAARAARAALAFQQSPRREWRRAPRVAPLQGRGEQRGRCGRHRGQRR